MEPIFVNREFVQGIEGKNTATGGQEYAQENNLVEQCQDIVKGEGLLNGEHLGEIIDG